MRRHLDDAEGRRVRSEEEGEPPRRLLYQGTRLAAEYREGLPERRCYAYDDLGEHESLLVVSGTGPGDGVFHLVHDFQGSGLHVRSLEARASAAPRAWAGLASCP